MQESAGSVHTKETAGRSANERPENFEPGGREDVTLSDILPNPNLLGPEEDPFDPDFEKFGPEEPSDAVKPRFSTVGKPIPDEPAPKGLPLDPTKNNSPQPSNGGWDEGEYDECPNPVVVERTAKESEPNAGEVEYIEIECNRKWCPYCGPKLRRRYVAHFTEQFREFTSLKFVTLTLDPKAFGEETQIDKNDFAETRKYLLHIWERKFVKRVKRRSDGEITYVASVERHQSGQAHMHVVMSCTLTEDELREQWFQSGGGVVMDATAILSESHAARKVGYVMKYCFQDAMQSDGRNSIFCTEGIGYYSQESKDRRKEHMESNSEGSTGDEWDRDRYEFSAPPGAGHADNGDRVTEAERERFDRIADKARTTTYRKWHGESLPKDGVRVRYDRETDEVVREPIRMNVDGEVIDRA
jgi:hypothetical protein